MAADTFLSTSVTVIGGIIAVAGAIWGILWGVKTAHVDARAKRRDVLHEIMIKPNKNIDLIEAKKILQKEGHPCPDKVIDLFNIVDKIGYLYFSKTLKWGELIYFLPLLELLRNNKENAEAYADEQGFLYAKYLIKRYDKEYNNDKGVQRKNLKICKKFGLRNLSSTLFAGEKEP